MAAIIGIDVQVKEISKMVFEENRLNTFLDKGQWPFLKDCNCTPEKVSNKSIRFLKKSYALILKNCST